MFATVIEEFDSKALVSEMPTLRPSGTELVNTTALKRIYCGIADDNLVSRQHTRTDTAQRDALPLTSRLSGSLIVPFLLPARGFLGGVRLYKGFLYQAAS